MAKMIKSRGQKKGLPPGTLVHIGDRRKTETRCTVMEYDGKTFSERLLDDPAVCPAQGEAEGVIWIDMEGVSQVDFLQKLGSCYDLHPLVLEDIVNTDQRPKKEDYGDYVYIVVKSLSLANSGSRIESEQVSLILGDGFVLTFQEGLDGDPFAAVRERLRNGKGLIRSQGADYLAYCLLDSVVDGYFSVLERLADHIETLEDRVVAITGKMTLAEIHRLKREIAYLRKAVWPLREVIGGLERRDTRLVQESTVVYLRDLYDHTVQIIDTVETFRDMLSGMLDIYLSSTANRTNEVMKVLTIIATIFMPLTFIVGLYGMNFKNMPEYDLPWGYPAVLIVMASIAVVMTIWFKRKKWL